MKTFAKWLLVGSGGLLGWMVWVGLVALVVWACSVYAAPVLTPDPSSFKVGDPMPSTSGLVMSTPREVAGSCETGNPLYAEGWGVPGAADSEYTMVLFFAYPEGGIPFAIVFREKNNLVFFNFKQDGKIDEIGNQQDPAFNHRACEDLANVRRHTVKDPTKL